MKLSLSVFLSFFLLPCFSNTETVREFNLLKEDIVNELTAVNNNYNYVINQMNIVYENGLQEYQYITWMASQNPNSEVYSGMVSGAQSMMGYFEDFRSIRNDMVSFTTSINNAINNINSLTIPTNLNCNVDLTPVLNAISNNTFQIVSSIGNGVNVLTNSISENVSLCLGRADVAISNLVAIVDLLSNLDLGGSSGGGSSDVDLSTIEDYLSDLLACLTSCLSALNGIDSNVEYFVQWALSVNSPFRKFFTLANSRIELPDSSLSSDLNLMWNYCIEEMTNIVFSPNSYSLSSQVYPVTVDLGANGIRLSNEGLISLENLAFNQRQYLCSIEMLNQLRDLNATNNLAWITNYLGTVQRTFYDYFNLTDIPKNRNTSYYFNSHLILYTNFLSRAFNRKAVGNTWWDYYSDRTNIFERLEIQLMTLNGLFPNGLGSLDDFESISSDEETLERNIRYSTNYLASVASEVSSVSNSVSFVFDKYLDLVQAFRPQLDNDSGGIRVMPSIDFGGIQFDHIDITNSTIEPISEPMRLMFSAVWWTSCVFLAFRFFVILLRVLGSVVVIIQKLFGMVVS